MNHNNSNVRFGFGKNWINFLNLINEDKILEAEKSLKEKLGIDDLKDKVFLDIGSGSGLFSLAAYRLGATVFSFDYDPNSVECTRTLKERFANNATNWVIEQGSVLDNDFLKKFNKVDIVYSWGVLHHTGSMYESFENIYRLVNDDGLLFISIYNDQGAATNRWKWIKKAYNKNGTFIKSILCFYTLVRQWTLTFIRDIKRYGNPFKSWKAYGNNNRGMSAWHDIVDWTGGYPFEVARPEEVFNFFRSKNYTLLYLKTCAGGLGCNEFVFKKA